MATTKPKSDPNPAEGYARTNAFALLRFCLILCFFVCVGVARSYKFGSRERSGPGLMAQAIVCVCGAHACQITEYTITKYTFLIVIVIVMQRPNRRHNKQETPTARSQEQ